MARKVSAVWVVLLVLWLPVLGRCEGEEVQDLEGEVKRLTSSLQVSVREIEGLKTHVASLESRLQDADSRKKDLEALQKEQLSKVAELTSKLEAAEKAAKSQASLRQLKEDELQRALKDATSQSEQLKATQANLKSESKILDQLAALLIPQGAAVHGPERGQLLLQHVKLALEQQTSLTKEAGKLKTSVQSLEQQLSAIEAQSAAIKKGKGAAESEVQRLGKRVVELEKRAFELEAIASRHNELMDEVSKHWLPPWLVDAVEAAQVHANHHWEKTAAPTIKLVRSQSLDALEYTKKQAEPHVSYLLKNTRELAQSTRDSLRPHLETAVARHAEAMAWLSEQSSVAQKALEPHMREAWEATAKALDHVNQAASPYLKQASDVVTPYYQEAYTAAKPGLDAMHSAALQYWEIASKSLGPQLEQLAEKSAHYHRQVSGIVGNVSQQVAGAELSSDALLFAEVGAYLLALILSAVILITLFRVCLRGGKEDSGKKGKGKPAVKKHHQPHHVKKAHHSSHHHK